MDMGMDTKNMDMDTVTKNDEINKVNIDAKKLIHGTLKRFIKNISIYLIIVSIVASCIYIFCKKTYIPEYRTSATYVVTPTNNVNYNDSGYNHAVLQQIVKSFPYIIMSNVMQDLIKKDIEMDSVPGKINAKSLEDTNAFTISVTSNSPELSKKILESIISHYSDVGKEIIGNTMLSMFGTDLNTTTPINGETPQKYAMIGILVVTAIFILLFAFQTLNQKIIHSRNDIINNINLRCLAEIPRIVLKNGTIPGKKKMPYAFFEGIRKLKVRAEQICENNHYKVILVSSSVPNEGKSTIAANLAWLLSASEKKVVLADMDAHNTSIKKMFHYKKTDELLAETNFPNLKILPPPEEENIKEVLSSEKTKEIFEKLKKEYDYIVVDTPPSSILSDASDIADFCDCGIFVIRQDMPALKVEEGIDMLSDTNLTIIGCVLNYSRTRGYYKYYKYKGY